MSCTWDIFINSVNSCKVCSEIHIALTPLLSGWISQCPQCSHLRRMYVDGLVLKIVKVIKFIVAMVIGDGETSIFILCLHLL